MIKLSIIVPAYNVEKYISRCLNSLVEQDLATDEYEIIVINDGSSDKTSEIVAEYARKYVQIRFYSQENKGVSTARNKGLVLARGEYVCFVDSDDFLALNRLGTLVNAALTNELQVLTYGICGGGEYFVNQLFEKEATISNLKIEEIQTGIEYIGRHNYNNGACWYLIQHQFLKNIELKFVDGRFGEDGMFSMELFLRADRVSAVNVYIYGYIIRPNSIITTRTIKHMQKVADDYRYVIDHLTKLIVHYKPIMTDACYRRVVCRRDSYIFFLLIRLLRMNVHINVIDSVLKDLRTKKLYPFGSMSLDYRSFKYTLLYYILNCAYLYKMVCRLHRILKRR